MKCRFRIANVWSSLNKPTLIFALVFSSKANVQYWEQE